MKHIIFNEPDEQVLQAALALDETMQGDIILIRDDYAVGPIANGYTGEGIQARFAWWQQMHDTIDAAMNSEVDDQKTIATLVGELRRNPEEIVWLWVAQNKHDVSGYYWTLRYLREFQGRIYILYLNNLPFINESGGIFYPQWLSEIPAKEFLKAKKLARPITLSEFEIDPDEWQRLMQEDMQVRLLEGGKKLIQADVDYYDKALAKYVMGDWQKVNRLLTSFYNKEKETTGDTFLLWRLKIMSEAHGWEWRNDGKGMRMAELRNPLLPALRGVKAEATSEE